jgi:HK97 family phage major capsid protein
MKSHRFALSAAFLAVLAVAALAAVFGHPITNYLPPDVLATLGAVGGMPFMVGEVRTLSEQREAFEAQRKAKQAEMAAIMSGAAGRTLDESEGQKYDSLDEEIKALDTHIVRLKRAEAAQLESAATTTVTKNGEGNGADPTKAPLQLKQTEKLEPGQAFARFVMCHVAAKGNAHMAFEIAKRHFPANEALVGVIKAQAEGYNLGAAMQQKANVNAGTSLDSTWAAPLVQYQNFAGDFVEFLRPQTIIGKFGTGGVPALNRIPFNVRIPSQTSGGAGYWVGEGAPKPLTKFDFTTTELRWAKVANIAVLTDELIRFSDPSAEMLVRNALAGALIARLDTDFVDPGKAAVANVSPASITNSVAGIPSSGTDADAIRADIRALWAPFIAANNPPTTAVYIMSATTALALSLMQNALGQREFPGVSMMGGTFNGVPVIVSEYLDNSAGSAGGIVILANARDIWLADDGQVTIDASREASLQMDDAPTNNSSTGTEAQVVSMFQTNSVALRAERYINWSKRRSTAVQWLDTVSWGV